MKGWVAVRSPSDPTFDLKFFPCDYSCAELPVCFGEKRDKKGKRNKDFEALYYVWQGVQKY